MQLASFQLSFSRARWKTVFRCAHFFPLLLSYVDVDFLTTSTQNSSEQNEILVAITQRACKYFSLFTVHCRRHVFAAEVCMHVIFMWKFHSKCSLWKWNWNFLPTFSFSPLPLLSAEKPSHIKWQHEINSRKWAPQQNSHETRADRARRVEWKMWNN